MAQSRQTGDLTVIADNPIAAVLEAPLDPEWTVESLAERMLGAIAADPSPVEREFIYDIAEGANRQAQRLIRPLLAGLAINSNVEAGASAGLHTGCFSFRRSGVMGPIWIHGQFENRPGCVRLTIRRSSALPDSDELPQLNDTVLAHKTPALPG